MFVSGWTKPMGDKTAYLTFYRGGTGRCVALQSSLPSLSSSELDYVTEAKYSNYTEWFKQSVSREENEDNPMDRIANLSTRQRFIRSQYDSRGVTELTSSQKGVEWHKMRMILLTSTATHKIISRDASVYTEDEVSLLANNIGMTLTHPPESEEEDDEDYQNMTDEELRQFKVPK